MIPTTLIYTPENGTLSGTCLETLKGILQGTAKRNPFKNPKKATSFSPLTGPGLREPIDAPRRPHLPEVEVPNVSETKEYLGFLQRIYRVYRV